MGTQEGGERGSGVEANQEQKQMVVYSRTGDGTEELLSCLGAQKEGKPWSGQPGEKSAFGG